MLSFLTASVLRDLSFRTRLGRRPHTINTDSLASLHSTQLARLTLTFFFPRSTKCNRDAVSSLIVGGARIQADKWLRTSSPTTSIPRKTFTGCCDVFLFTVLLESLELPPIAFFSPKRSRWRMIMTWLGAGVIDVN